MNCNNKLPTTAKIVNPYILLGQIMPQKNRQRAFKYIHSWQHIVLLSRHNQEITYYTK